jgi:hypothetical protein
MKFFAILIGCLFWLSFRLPAQLDTLYAIEARIMQGDLPSLAKMGTFLDSKKQIIEYLGHHRLHPTEGEIARRIIRENTLFTASEVTVDEDITAQDFSTFLATHPVRFCDTVTAFLVTPLNARQVSCELRPLSAAVREQLRKQSQESWGYVWLKFDDLYQLIARHDARCLPMIAAQFYRHRNRHNRYYFGPDEFTDWLKLLTGMEVGVPNMEGTITFFYDRDYYGIAALNLTIYWIQNYHVFVWDPSKQIFRNPAAVLPVLDEEVSLFEMLESKDDSVAMYAYRKLATGNPTQVTKIARQYVDNFNSSHNRSIGTFPYKFLQVLPWIAHYCCDHGIDLEGNAEMQIWFSELSRNRTDKESRLLEDQIISELSLRTITALEFWALLNEGKWASGHSVGRILDKFYSNHWQEIITDSLQLEIYLRKSIWYSQLGIIGVCNLYLNKFILQPKSIVSALEAISTTDQKLQSQIKKTISYVHQAPQRERFAGIDWPSQPNPDKNLTAAYQRITQSVFKEHDTKFKVSDLFANIRYDQIGEAFQLLEKADPKYLWDEDHRYRFIENDFGLYFGNLNDDGARKSFLHLHATMTEEELYRHSLDYLGVDYRHANGSMDHEKIMDILEYDIVTAFVGGGGGSSEHGVYGIIKLLELHSNTRLGFPWKRCFYGAYVHCGDRDQAQAWMKYLVEKGLAKLEPTRPRSFGYEY